jgi:hypothetical protein
MQSTVMLDLLGTAGAKVAAGTTPAPPLVAACAGRPDPRRRQGRRSPLPFLLGALVRALLCNCATLEAVGPWNGAPRSAPSWPRPSPRSASTRPAARSSAACSRAWRAPTWKQRGPCGGKGAGPRARTRRWPGTARPCGARGQRTTRPRPSSRSPRPSVQRGACTCAGPRRPTRAPSRGRWGPRGPWPVGASPPPRCTPGPRRPRRSGSRRPPSSGSARATSPRSRRRVRPPAPPPRRAGAGPRPSPGAAGAARHGPCLRRRT